MNIEDVKLINLGTVNKNKVVIGDLTLYFSYETIVAYEYNGNLHVRQNDWSTTTGKFLNTLATKSNRIEGTLFESQLNDVLSRLGLKLS